MARKNEKRREKREQKFSLARDALSRLGQHAKAQEEGRKGERNIPPSNVHPSASRDASAVAT